MLNHRLAIPALGGLGLLLLAGCAGGGPAAPDTSAPAAHFSTDFTIPPEATLPPGVLAAGALTVHLDPATLSAELLPWREGQAVGDSYHEIGVTQALRERGAFSLGGVRWIEAGVLGLTLKARHPFPLANRPDLSLFNLKVHVMSEGATQFGAGLRVNPTFLRNRDGYSALWDSQADARFFTEATLHPYRIMSLDPTRPAEFDPFAPAGYNVWAPGSEHAAELELVLPETAGPADLRLFLTADYGQSAVRATRQTPEYDLPRFAGKAPWRVLVHLGENTLATNDRTSTLALSLEVWDWGHGAGINTDITSIEINAPMLEDPLTIPVSPSGLAEPLVFDAVLTNRNAAPEGLHYGLVSVFDSSAAGVALKDDLVTPFTVNSYHTYQVFPIAVGPPTGGQPTAVISAPCPEVTYWAAGLPIDFSGLGSWDDETPEDLLVFEWDLDYAGNPAAFQVDQTGRDITWTPPLGTNRTVVIALRVTDEDGLFGITTVDIPVATVPGGPFANRTNLTNTPDIEEDIGRAQTGFDRDHMVIDADGNIHIFTLSRFFYTAVTTYNFQTGESTGPEELFRSEYLYNVPIVRKAPDGRIHLLYMAADRFNDNGYDRPAIGWRLYDPATRGVTEEVLIAEWDTPNPQEPTFNIPHMQGISFDIDSSNRMVATYEEWWADSVPGNELSSYDHEMFYIRGTSEAGWEPAQKVPWSTYTSRGDAFGSAGWKRARPDLRVTDDDLFHIIYLYNPDEDIDGPLPMWHRTYDYGNDLFSEALVAVEDTGNRTYAQVQLFPAPGGNLVMTHQTWINQIWFQRYTKATQEWLQPVSMTSPAKTGGIQYVNLPTAAVTPNGTVFIAFQALNPAPLPDLEEFYYKFFPFDATPEEIFDAPNVPLVPCFSANGQREPQMAVDEVRNRLVVVYEDPEGVPKNDLWIAWKGLP